jgi:hypothetical protein
MKKLKFFLKLWLYFIGFAIVFGLVVWATTIVGNYNFVAGLVVFVIGLGGIASAVFAIGLRE